MSPKNVKCSDVRLGDFTLEGRLGCITPDRCSLATSVKNDALFSACSLTETTLVKRKKTIYRWFLCVQYH